MQSFEKEELEGLTLEEAVQFLTPRGWRVMVHKYEDSEYPVEELEKTYRIRIDRDGFHVDEPTVSLDIMDGKVYEFSVYYPDEKV